VKILVISMAGIGDTLLATPLIHELRANFPGAMIDALVLWDGSKDLLENNPHVNRVFQKNLINTGKLEAFHFLWSLRHEHYDASINTYPQSRMHYRIAARIIGATTRFSHKYESFIWLDKYLVNRTLPQDYAKHAIENNFDVLPLLGAKKMLPSHEMEIFLTPNEEKWADEFLAKHKLAGEKILGIHVGSGGTKNLALRRWPLENYAELVRQLLKKHPELAVIFFGGQEEKGGHEKIRALAAGDNLFFPKTRNLRQAAALIAKCDAFLSADTSLMHLAAAMRVPGQIVIETPTWNRTVEPYGNSFTLVKNPVVNGRGLDFYRYDGGDIKGTHEELLACMASIKIEDVFETVTKMI
jgi:lipopolysaccharide heptosyltransferase II